MTEALPVKVVIVGEAGVGKTSIMQLYLEGTFSKNQTTTIGATCCDKIITVNGISYNVSIWDTAGQECYRTIVPLYFRGASIAIVVFDITNKKSLEAVGFWVNTLKENLGNNLILSLCANKIDLETSREVDEESILVASHELKVPFFYTSAAIGIGVHSMFEYCLSQMSTDNVVVTEEKEALVKVVDTRPQKDFSGCLC